jgi:hypothetical protein
MNAFSPSGRGMLRRRYPWFMQRHENVTDEYVAELRAGRKSLAIPSSNFFLASGPSWCSGFDMLAFREELNGR